MLCVLYLAIAVIHLSVTMATAYKKSAARLEEVRKALAELQVANSSSSSSDDAGSSANAEQVKALGANIKAVLGEITPVVDKLAYVTLLLLLLFLLLLSGVHRSHGSARPRFYHPQLSRPAKLG